jgi:hypothetical protein
MNRDRQEDIVVVLRGGTYAQLEDLAKLPAEAKEVITGAGLPPGVRGLLTGHHVL